MRLVVFKMMHRSGGRQGYGQLLTALAALTDPERSRQSFSFDPMGTLDAPPFPRSRLFPTPTHKRGTT